MLNLPQNTEINRLLTKKQLFEQKNVEPTIQRRIDAYVSKIVLTNWIDSNTIPALKPCDSVKALAALQIFVKQPTINKKVINDIYKLIPQTMLLAITYQEQMALAFRFANYDFETNWLPTQQHTLTLQGNNLQTICENLALQISNTTLENNRTFEQQMARNAKKLQLEKQLEKLTQQARRQQQPRRQFELHQQMVQLVQQIENLKHIK